MADLPAPVPSFWWSGDRTERYWVEQLRTDEYGDRLIAPDDPRYATMHGVEVGDLVLRWYSERHPDGGPRRSGVHAVSRVIGRLRPSTDLWEGSTSVEIPLTRRTMLDRPVLLTDLKRREDEFRASSEALAEAVAPMPRHSPWQFPRTGLKPMTKYLTKLIRADLEVIVADHPHLATAMTRA